MLGSQQPRCGQREQAGAAQHARAPAAEQPSTRPYGVASAQPAACLHSSEPFRLHSVSVFLVVDCRGADWGEEGHVRVQVRDGAS